MADRQRASTPATALLQTRGISHVVHSYEHDPRAVAGGLGYGAEAAQALAVDPARIFKTLLVQMPETLGMVVVPVLTRVDLKAAAAALGAKKAAMADPRLAERTTGYVVGGISPIGGRRELATVIDASAEVFSTIYVSGGRRGLDIELSPQDLAMTTRGEFAIIAT